MKNGEHWRHWRGTRHMKRDWDLEDQERERKDIWRRIKEEEEETRVNDDKDEEWSMKYEEATVMKYLFVFDTCVSIN